MPEPQEDNSHRLRIEDEGAAGVARKGGERNADHNSTSVLIARRDLFLSSILQTHLMKPHRAYEYVSMCTCVHVWMVLAHYEYPSARTPSLSSAGRAVRKIIARFIAHHVTADRGVAADAAAITRNGRWLTIIEW